MPARGSLIQRVSGILQLHGHGKAFVEPVLIRNIAGRTHTELHAWLPGVGAALVVEAVLGPEVEFLQWDLAGRLSFGVALASLRRLSP